MPSIIATPGASNANSYCDVAFADDYFGTRLGSDDWDNVDKEVALIQATRLLESLFDFPGFIAENSTQALRWPRRYVYDRDERLLSEAVIPKQVKQAVCELALSVGRDGEYLAEVDNTKAVRVGPIRVDSQPYGSDFPFPNTVLELMNGYGTYKGTVGGSTIRSIPVYRA